MRSAEAYSKYTRLLSDGFLQSALENKLECILILDLIGTVQFANPFGAMLLGAPDPFALAGADWRTLWVERDRSEAQAALNAAARGEPQRWTGTAPREAGEPRRLDSVISPLRDTAGSPAGLLIVSRDITELEDARRAADQQSFVLRSAAEAAHLLGWEIDFGRNVILTLAGVAAPQPYDLTIDDSLSMYGPEDRVAILELIERARLYGEAFRYEAPYELGDGSRGWYRSFGKPVYEGGVCVGIRGMTMEISEEITARQTIQRAEQGLNLAVQLAGMRVYELDFAQRTATQMGASEGIFDTPPPFEDMWPEAKIVDLRDRARVHAEWARSQEEQIPFRSEFRINRQDNAEVWVYAVAEIVREGERPLRLVGALMDITERKRAELEMLRTMTQMREHEERQKLLLDELNHRVKNTLAAVQSVAVQTLTKSCDPQEGRELFIERLLALSNTHNLLVKHAWEGASFHEIVEAALKPYGRAYRYDGPDLRLDPNFAVSLGMAVHELATNALKHGAWRDEGQVSIVTDADDIGVRITWRESGGPPVSEPARRGFGSRLLQRGVAGELGAKVTLDFPREGLICSIEAPASPRLRPIPHDGVAPLSRESQLERAEEPLDERREQDRPSPTQQPVSI